MQAQMNRLCDRLNHEYRGTNKVLRLDWMFACYVADTVVGYCFENKYSWLEAPDFRCDFAEAMNSLLENVHLVTQFPWVARILNAMPKDILAKLNPDMQIVNDFNKVSLLELLCVMNEITGHRKCADRSYQYLTISIRT